MIPDQTLDEEVFRPRRIHRKVGKASTGSHESKIRVGTLMRCAQSALIFGSNSSISKPFRPVLVLAMSSASDRFAVLPATSSSRVTTELFLVIRRGGLDQIPPSDIFWVPPQPKKADSSLRCMVEYVSASDLQAGRDVYAHLSGDTLRTATARATPGDSAAGSTHSGSI